jgi:septal ring-binding cell division protein DamX
VSPERPDPDDFLEDEEQEEYGQRSIFATGWFRAVLVLLVLAVVAVIAVPLIGGWFEPTPPPKVTTKPSEPSSTPVPVPSTAPPAGVPATPPGSQMPSAAAPPVTPPPAAAPTVPPPSTMAPPAVSRPTPAPARPEMPPASASNTPKAPEKAKAPERTAAATPSKSTAKPAASSGNYWVQVGAFKESGNAEGLARKLRSEGYSVQVARVTRDAPLHVVRVGGYPDRSRASAAREELQGKGQTGFVTSGPAK